MSKKDKEKKYLCLEPRTDEEPLIHIWSKERIMRFQFKEELCIIDGVLIKQFGSKFNPTSLLDK